MAKKKSTSKKDPPKDSSPARKRVSFSISSDPDTVEGRIVEHLRNNKMVNMRESVVRALKAYYLPWAYEDDVSKEEAQVLARGAIDELEFRIFQIRRHFLSGEAYGPKLSESLGGNTPSTGKETNGHGPLSADTVIKKVTPPPRTIDANPASIADILDDEDIDPDVLDDF
ncbi:MAG: hypothetical protein AAF821_23745 [Cyanobacteria bacterium P01_D01_bin.156]